MPELPEVETTVQGLKKKVLGLTITDISTTYRSTFHHGKDSIKDPAYFAYFKKEAVDQKIIGARRRAKNILIDLENGHTILVHMKMTGHLLYGDYDRSDPFNRHIRLVFTLSNNKTLELCDMRKFAKVTLLPRNTNHNDSAHLKGIGPEPLEPDFTLKLLRERLSLRPNGKIKTVLMDQKIVAGIGNIYSDEALWRASIHPERKSGDLNPTELKDLHRAIIFVLRNGIDFGGDSMSDYRNIDGKRGEFQGKHQAYRKTNEKCLKKSCTGIIQRKVIGGRSSHFCNFHQK